MKKLVIALVAAVLVLTSCTSTNPYAGKYTGTFSFITSNTTKNGTVLFTENPLTSNMLLYSIISLSPVNGSSNVYVSNEVSAELITQLLQYIGNQSDIYNTATEQIKNVKIEATFSGNQVNIDMYYEILILELMTTRVSIVKFAGTK